MIAVLGRGGGSFLSWGAPAVTVSRGVRRKGSQAYLGPRAHRPGDMMFYWVPPACGGAAAHSVQAVRVPCAAGL